MCRGLPYGRVRTVLRADAALICFTIALAGTGLVVIIVRVVQARDASTEARAAAIAGCVAFYVAWCVLQLVGLRSLQPSRSRRNLGHHLGWHCLMSLGAIALATGASEASDMFRTWEIALCWIFVGAMLAIIPMEYVAIVNPAPAPTSVSCESSSETLSGDQSTSCTI